MTLNEEFLKRRGGRRAATAVLAAKPGEDGRRQAAKKAPRQAGVIVEHDAMQACGSGRRSDLHAPIHFRRC
jgi:hypothetical protein